MDILAPCDFYGRYSWAKLLEANCLNCVRLDAEPACPELCRRFQEGVDLEVVLSTFGPTTCVGCEGSGAGGDVC